MKDDLELYKAQDMIRQIERLNNNCEDNMKRLNSMMLELKGIIAMVRPMAKKNAWYGEEILTEGSGKCITLKKEDDITLLN